MPPVELPAAEKSANVPNIQRRRLAQAALTGPVIIATLRSRPVLGATPYSCTVSGQLSGNMSGRPQEGCSSLGKSPGYWKNSGVHSWYPLVPTALFSSVFVDAYPGLTLLQAVGAGGGLTLDKKYPALGRAAVAAWINAYLMPGYPLTQREVVTMFNSIILAGSCQVTPTVAFNAGQLLTYLESTYD